MTESNACLDHHDVTGNYLLTSVGGPCNDSLMPEQTGTSEGEVMAKANNQMDAEMRRLFKAGRKAGWTFELNNSQHFDVIDPNGIKVTTIAPRNRHWKLYAVKHLKPAGFPV